MHLLKLIPISALLVFLAIDLTGCSPRLYKTEPVLPLPQSLLKKAAAENVALQVVGINVTGQVLYSFEIGKVSVQQFYVLVGAQGLVRRVAVARPRGTSEVISDLGVGVLAEDGSFIIEQQYTLGSGPREGEQLVRYLLVDKGGRIQEIATTERERAEARGYTGKYGVVRDFNARGEILLEEGDFDPQYFLIDKSGKPHRIVSDKEDETLRALALTTDGQVICARSDGSKDSPLIRLAWNGAKFERKSRPWGCEKWFRDITQQFSPDGCSSVWTTTSQAGETLHGYSHGSESSIALPYGVGFGGGRFSVDDMGRAFLAPLAESPDSEDSLVWDIGSSYLRKLRDLVVSEPATAGLLHQIVRSDGAVYAVAVHDPKTRDLKTKTKKEMTREEYVLTHLE